VTSIAMLFTFIGIIFLFALTQHSLGEGTLVWGELMADARLLPPKLLAATFVLIFIGFAAKAGISPLHTWLPHAHGKAPSAVSAILSGSLLNVGMYGILRMYAVVKQTGSALPVSELLICFGILTVAISAFTMLRQKNLKKLIAFSSVEHMGLMLAGLGIGTPAAIFWMLYHTLAHSLTKTLLFFCAGILHRQFHSNKAEDMKDALRLQPVASAGLILGAVAISGMPPFPMFVSKLMLLLQLWGFSGWLAFALLILLMIASTALALYLVRLFSHVSEHERGAHIHQYKADWTMEAPIVAIILAMLALGLFFPGWLADVLNGILGDLMLGGS
jgi:hydrogenase-4 component F